MENCGICQYHKNLDSDKRADRTVIVKDNMRTHESNRFELREKESEEEYASIRLNYLPKDIEL